MILITNNVCRIRKENGMTQTELAERVQVQQSTISMIETGERTPSLPMMIRLATALGVTVNDLLEVTDEAVDA